MGEIPQNILEQALLTERETGVRLFKQDPWAPGLRTHKIEKLSARAGTTVWSVRIEGDLRAIFVLDGDTVLTLDIGTHDIYR